VEFLMRLGDRSAWAPAKIEQPPPEDEEEEDAYA
jgi:hypothetical protein